MCEVIGKLQVSEQRMEYTISSEFEDSMHCEA